MGEDFWPDTYDASVADRVIEQLRGGDGDLVIVNFANVDVLAHIEDEPAVVRAVEAVDMALGRVLEAARGPVVGADADQGAGHDGPQVVLAHQADDDGRGVTRLGQYGLDAPETTITVRFADDGEPGVIRMKRHPVDDAYYYVTQDTGAILQAARGQVERILTDLAQFRSRDLFRFPKPHAVKLEFQFEGKGYVLERVHGRWVVKNPEDKALGNQSDALVLLDALSPVFAAGVAVKPEEHPNTGLDHPIFTVYVTTHDEKDPNATPVRHGPLSIANPVPGEDQRRYAASDARPGIYRVRQDIIETVRELLDGLRDM